MNDLTYWEALLCVTLANITGEIAFINWNNELTAIIPVMGSLVLVWCISFFKKKE